MLYAVNVALRRLTRNKVYVISYIILLSLTNVYLAYFFLLNSSAVQFLSYSMRLGQIALVYFSILSYEYHSFVQSEITEITQIHFRATEKMLGSNTIIISSLLLIWATIILAWQIAFCRYNGFSYSPFLLHALFSVILNCILPGLLGIMVGVVLALSARKTKAYCLLVLFLLITSNLPSQFFTVEEVAGIPILNIFDWFSFLAPNLNYVADSIYGISNELYRWILAIGWISALLLTVSLKLKKNSNSILTFIIALLLIISMLCIMRFANRENDSIIKKDFRTTGTLCSEILYRREKQQSKEEKSNFSIISCDLKINVISQIQATARIKVDLSNLDEYHFTLWHSLHIDEITDEFGRLLSFNRDGDFLTIFTPNVVNEFHITYSGNCGKYFSNYQGIALPGYVPYYPWAGHIIVWDEYHEEIKNDHRNPTSSFRIEITSPLVVACNLPSVKPNTFEGCAESISLYAGLIAPTMVDGEFCYCSPVSDYHLSLEGHETIWDNLSSLVGETHDLDLKGKTIFIQPETIMVNGNIRERMVSFSDHIILGSWVTNAETICLYYLLNLIPQRNETYLLYDLFQTEMTSNPSNNKTNQKPSWESLSILTQYTLPNEISDEEAQEAFAAAAVNFKSLWNYQIKTLGSDTVLKEVYQYMISSDFNQNQIEFLYNLGG